MNERHTAYLSIGSNKGDKQNNLENAIEMLSQYEEMEIISTSLFYKTEPQNFKDQNWFVNAALKVRTQWDAQTLMRVLKKIEKNLDADGKEFRFGPRIIDLDIIFFENQVVRDEELIIPHPRMHERCFVLKPMCDIGASVVHPIFKLTTQKLLEKLETKENQEVIPLD